MIRNYLLVTLRNLRRHFTYSFVNIFGLTVGLACTLVIGFWVFQEYSYEKHFRNADHIYRIGVNFFNIGDMSIGPSILKERLAQYPEVKHVASLAPVGDAIAVINHQEIPVENVFSADTTFFKLFSYHFKYGNPDQAMSEPQSIVVTTDVAIQLFGRDDVLNEVIELKNETRPYTITGVVEVQGKSHIPAEVWIAEANQPAEVNWTSASSYIYAFVDGQYPGHRLNEILVDQMDEVRTMLAPDQTPEEFEATGLYKFLPMAITDIHLNSNFKFEPAPTGNKQTTDVFAGIAILILTLASINFINISTARATTRAKEVGIRKALGTNRSALIFQFIVESIVVCLIAITLAIGLGEFFLNSFERITGLELLPTLFIESGQFIIVYLGAVILGIIAGIYPAFYITRFEPSHVLKGKIGTGEKGLLRNGLVLFQFAISISLLIVSMFIFHQLRFIENKDMGFDQDNVMVISNLGKVPDHAVYLKEELLKKSYVQSASINHRLPASTSYSVTAIKQQDKEVWIQQFAGDEDMLECLGFQLLSGRNFSQDIASDTSALILNESAVKSLELKDPINRTLNNGKYRVIGVISDFNYESLKNKIGPAMLKLEPDAGHYLSIKFAGQHATDLIADINSLWTEFGVDDKPDFYFLDGNFNHLVEQEKVLSKAISIFTVLAMFISCLGLYGLSIFTAERRTKEIGIRRVLGASVSNITRLLSQSFARPIIIAFIIAIPVAYLITKNWLDNYAYRIAIDWWPFILGGIIALTLGLLTISWQSIRAALRNPVVSLRSE